MAKDIAVAAARPGAAHAAAFDPVSARSLLSRLRTFVKPVHGASAKGRSTMQARLATAQDHIPKPLLELPQPWENAAVETLRRAVTFMIGTERGHDLTQRQLGTLLLVACTPGPHTIRGIAARLALLKPAVTRSVDVLEGEGLVRRRPDPADRRSVLVVPTPAAQLFLNEITAAMRPG